MRGWGGAIPEKFPKCFNVTDYFRVESDKFKHTIQKHVVDPLRGELEHMDLRIR